MGRFWWPVCFRLVCVFHLVLLVCNNCHGYTDKRILMGDSNIHASAHDQELSQRLSQCEQSVHDILQQLGAQQTTINELSHMLQQKMGSVQEFALLRSEQEQEIESMKNQLMAQTEAIQALNQSKVTLENQMLAQTEAIQALNQSKVTLENQMATFVSEMNTTMLSWVKQQTDVVAMTTEASRLDNGTDSEIELLKTKVEVNGREIEKLHALNANVTMEINYNSNDIKSVQGTQKQHLDLVLEAFKEVDGIKHLVDSQGVSLIDVENKIRHLETMQRDVNQSCSGCSLHLGQLEVEYQTLNNQMATHEQNLQHQHDSIYHLTHNWMTDHNLLIQLNSTQCPCDVNSGRNHLSTTPVPSSTASSTEQPSTSLLAGGTTYIRWGSDVCPHNETVTDLVYHGFMAGSPHLSAGGSNYVCLTSHPNFHPSYNIAGHTLSIRTGGGDKRDGGSTSNINLIGVSYEASGAHIHPLTCSLCWTRQKSTTEMIPGQDYCQSGWEKEYNGYLMTDGTAASNFVCVDTKAQAYNGTISNANGQKLSVIEILGANLPSPPYIPHKPVTCAVCSK